VNGYMLTAATGSYRNGSDREVAPTSGESRPVSTQRRYVRIPRRSRPAHGAALPVLAQQVLLAPSEYVRVTDAKLAPSAKDKESWEILR
jgi:hypothetical protein